MKIPSAEDIERFITSKVKKAVVGKKCMFLGYGGGILVENDFTFPGAPAKKDYTHKIVGARFDFTTKSDDDSNRYGSTPIYELYLTVVRLADGYESSCIVDIRDVL